MRNARLASALLVTRLATLKVPTLRDWLPDPAIFQDTETAATRLADAIAAKEAIVIFGDYDVYGATSAAVLIR